jgi:hypothetical protein
MEETQNNTTTTSIQHNDLAEKKTVLSRELRQSTVHLIDAGLIIGSQLIGLPPIIIPFIKPGREFIFNAVSDPYVQDKAKRIGSQIGSTTSGVYSWTKNTASSAKDKTSQVVYTSYEYTKEKTRQGISATAGLIPEWKVYPGSIGLPNLGNLYRRSASTSPTREETR